MVDALSAYLREAAASRFDWTTRNCGQWVSDWVLARTGRDPFAPYRGRADYRALNLVAVTEEIMAPFPVVEQPQRGDVGIVLTPVPTAAICAGRRWAALAPQGLAAAAWPVLKAWRVSHA